MSSVGIRKFETRNLGRVIDKYTFDLFNWAQALPLTPIFLRGAILRLGGIGVGPRSYVHPGVRFLKRGIVTGGRCTIGAGSLLDGSGELVLGERVTLGPKVTLLTGTHDVMPSVFRCDRAQVTYHRTRIGNGCWLGAGVIVNAGVTVGEGCVIGSGAVITTDCEANGLYVGVPARRVKDLPLETRRPIEQGRVL